MNEQDILPLLGEFTDQDGQQWAFNEDSVLYLETEEGDAFWHFYRYHNLIQHNLESCAKLLRVVIKSKRQISEKEV